MTASDIAAWWGAALATLVFGWDIFKWRASRASVAVSVNTNMQMSGDPTETKYIFVEAVNRGDHLTTTHLGFYHYASRFHRLIRKRKGAGIVPNPGGGLGLPYELEPGKRWVGLVEQDGFFEAHKGGIIYAAIVHSGSKGESLCIVPLPK